MPDAEWTKGLWPMFYKFPHMLVGIGVVVSVFGGIGGYPGKLPVPDSEKLHFVLGGFVLVGVGVALYVWESWRGRDAQGYSIPNVAHYKAEIHFPLQNALVAALTDASGTVPKAPPGYVWRVLRGYPGLGGVIPQGNLDVDDATGRWRVVNFDVGGDPGRNDRRSLEIWLVGEDGRALLACWENDHLVHRKAMEQIKAATGRYGEWLGPIKTFTKDMVRCAKVDLVRL